MKRSTFALTRAVCAAVGHHLTVEPEASVPAGVAQCLADLTLRPNLNQLPRLKPSRRRSDEVLSTQLVRPERSVRPETEPPAELLDDDARRHAHEPPQAHIPAGELAHEPVPADRFARANQLRSLAAKRRFLAGRVFTGDVACREALSRAKVVAPVVTSSPPAPEDAGRSHASFQ